MQFIYEGEIYKYLYPHIRNELVFDIGSNIGQICKRLTSVNAKVIAVEPQKSLTVDNKNYSKVFAIKNLCVSDKVETIPFYKCSHHSTSSCRKDWRTKFQTNKKWEKVLMNTTTCDELIKEYGIPKFIKIDVEGIEDRILMGLSHQIDFISFEFANGFKDCALRCLDIIEEKFKFKTIMPFVKKKFTIKRNGKKVRMQHAYSGEYSTKKEFLKDFDHFIKLTEIDNRQVGDILIIGDK